MATMRMKSRVEASHANVVSAILPGMSDEIILVHSHHDSSFNGAIQDASGMSTVLAIAKYFSQIPMEKRKKTLMFAAMDSEVCIKTSFDKDDNLNIELSGKDMGVLIGKRGQTLDSIQYLTSLVVNKGNAGYVRVKVDTENYRARRKETLENLAKNIAYKVKRTKRPVSLEPMNPYERRIIHSALQNDKYVFTRSEGEEPFRHVVISLKREERRERRPRPDRSRNPEE